MTLVTAINVSLTFVDNEIFQGIGFQVESGDRIGLVGPNGSGKTTLMRLMSGEVSPDSGEVRIARGVRIGYLPQDVQESISGKLLESMLESVPGRTGLARDAERLEKEIKDARDEDEQTNIAAKLASVHQEMVRLDREFPPHEAEKILMGLGFDTSDFDRPVSSLSGGWKMRAALAGLLYRRPDILLLDEPTNHLDISSVHWLEEFLRGFRGALVLVSHDREFLNRQVNRIISFEPEGMRTYSGNYDFYLNARAEEKRALEAKARNQEQKAKEAQKFIDRFRAKASKARQAQSKIKLMEKMELVETVRREKTISFSFPEAPRSGRDVVSLRGISKAFGENELYRDVDLTVRRGERVAILGPNGCGKTTLLRIIAREITPDAGTVSLGHEVRMSYFAQHHSAMLNPHNTVIEEVYRAVPNATVGFVRNVCGAFLFSGNDVDKVIGVLSGGERARVCLAKLLVDPGNLMIMDEPTNHLDINSSEVLIKALAGYTGTLLFVSHNQSFINSLATRIWDISGGEVEEYPGKLDEYYAHCEAREQAAASASTAPEASAAPPGKDRPRKKDRKQEKREEAEKRRRIHETLEPIRRKLEDIEARISTLETEQKEIEKDLADPELFRDNTKSVPLLRRYNETRDELERLLHSWEEHQGRLETAKNELGV